MIVMARPTTSGQCDFVGSYMDGVHVKIAEAYKPPRKITFPAMYNNKLPDVTKYVYEFSLERSVLEKMSEWRKVRRINEEARRARLEEKKKEDEASPSLPVSTCDTVNQLPVQVAPAPETTILMPQPLTLPASEIQDHSGTNGLDFADFDNDTSSPFDNMELKTINDMEELAQVLQPMAQWVAPAKLEGMLGELTVNEKDQEKQEEKDRAADNQDETKDVNNTSQRSVSVIVQELQQELSKPYMENWKPWPDLESPNHEVGESVEQQSLSSTAVSSPLSDLSEEDQQLARHLADMGFPLSRAAQGIRYLGGEDNKKVVEYLLAIQSLEEIGISADDAEKALEATQYDSEKAKKYHENLCTLRDLGFPEDEASVALLKCNIDRDRALDLLIA